MGNTTGKKVRRSKVRRAKPDVAIKNEERAKENLEYKAAVLQSWLQNGFPHSLLQSSHNPEASHGESSAVSFPKTMRQFNRWQVETSEAHLIGVSRQILSNSNDTLRRYPKLRDRIGDTIRMLKVAWDSRDSHGASDCKRKLQNLLRISEARREALENELIDLKRLLSKLARDRDIAIASLADLKREFSSEIQRYSSGISSQGVAPTKAGVVKLDLTHDRESK